MSDGGAGDRDGVLVVLRGNSGSGKSTVARAVQQALAEVTCAVVEQDWVRRSVLREPDLAGALNIAVIEQVATTCLRAGLVVVVEGILNAHRYGEALARLHAACGGRGLFYAWDLPFDETVRRHATRVQRAHFTAEDMGRWYHGWQPLPFVQEERFDAATTEADAVERVLADVAGERRRRAG